MAHLDAALVAGSAIGRISGAEVVVVVRGVIQPTVNKRRRLGDVRADQLSAKPTSHCCLRSEIVDENVLRIGMNTSEH